jgi:hypothetical protein
VSQADVAAFGLAPQTERTHAQQAKVSAGRFRQHLFEVGEQLKVRAITPAPLQFVRRHQRGRERAVRLAQEQLRQQQLKRGAIGPLPEQPCEQGRDVFPHPSFEAANLV